MKNKLLNLSIILTSLIGYLEWGKSNTSFLFQAEAEVLSKLFQDPISVLHPLTILPLCGQIILVFTLFQRKPSKALTLIGLACLSMLLLVVFIVGLLSFNYKIIGSTIPFLIAGVLTMVHYRKRKAL